MSFDAYTLKKQYEKACLEQRNKNLIRLREKIAKLSPTEFSKQTGIQKSNLSALENGDRSISLFNIQVYKTYFKDNFDLDVSADFLMGYTDVIENQSMNVANDLGISDDAIQVFKEMSKEEHTTFNNLASVNNLLHLLLTSLWNYANNSTFIDIEITNRITGSKSKITDKNEIESMIKFQAIDTFNIVLYFIKESFRNSVSRAFDNKLRSEELELKINKLEEPLKHVQEAQDSPQKGSD